MLAYKAKNGPAPPYLMAMVKSQAVPQALRASNTARLEPPSLRTHGRQASRLFSVLAPRWNEHLAGVASLRSGRVPQLWKTSCVVPVPKTPHPKDLNSYRPVSLASYLMKTLKRLLLVHLLPLVCPAIDPLQFAYQPGIRVEDAIIHLLHRSLSHLENTGSTVRIMFFDFSSAFNTIQPMLPKDKLKCTGLDHYLTTWILDYLTNRPQYVRTQDCQSDMVVCSMGAPPFLFTLYTADFKYRSASCHLQKFSDDSAIVGQGVQRADKWCQRIRSTQEKLKNWWWTSAEPNFLLQYL
ncbi:hypothetical protein NFI96_003939 [Prochilodus magdalenae]|nr:hypothetical protein NFI96_003939 [Prochilodus magdalenae]